MKKKALFISSCDCFVSNFGGGKGSERNYLFLKERYELELINFSNNTYKKKYIYEIKVSENKLKNFFKSILLYSGNLTFSNEKDILKLIKVSQYEIIFLDSSHYGRLAKIIKKIKPDIKIVTFFQNIELDFILQYVINEKKIKKYLQLFKLPAIYYNEKMSVKYSNYIITLNTRDSAQLKKYYKGKSNLELPVSINDIEEQKREIAVNEELEKDYILFIGSYFYGNYIGINWFIEKVMPFINKKLLVVGKGFEKMRDKLEKNNVKVIGTVDDVSIYYRNADCVVMPILCGAGMKLKTVEAMMYGKSIYGTSEAFEGYLVDYDKIGGLCNSDKEFIEKLNMNNYSKYNQYSRKIYEELYSYDIIKRNFYSFLNKNKL